MKDIKLYSPLSIQIDDKDLNYHDGNIHDDPMYDESDTLIDLPEDDFPQFIRDIQGAIIEEYSSTDKRGLMQYFDKEKHPSIDVKVQSITTDVIESGDTLYTVTNIRLYSDDTKLSDHELGILKDYITGQYADGLGENLEQHAISTYDGEIYVSLWSPTHLDISTNPPQVPNVHIESHKPDAPMIGSDGNIFGQMAIAKKALIGNGQDYVVNEMVNRVMDSDSYDDALSVICEYVTPVDKKDYDRNIQRKNKPRER